MMDIVKKPKLIFNIYKINMSNEPMSIASILRGSAGHPLVSGLSLAVYDYFV